MQVGGQTTIATVTENALHAFWRAVAEQFPQLRTGDLHPDDAYSLSVAAERAIESWLMCNWPA